MGQRDTLPTPVSQPKKSHGSAPFMLLFRFIPLSLFRPPSALAPLRRQTTLALPQNNMVHASDWWLTFLGTCSGGGPIESRNCSSLVANFLGRNELWSMLPKSYIQSAWLLICALYIQWSTVLKVPFASSLHSLDRGSF